MSNITIFNYQNNRVRTFSRNGQTWFVAVDVCDALAIGNTTDAINRLDVDDLDKIEVTDALGRNQQTNVVNEPGLYDLILRSNKPEARAFKRWITHDVIPQIRKTGQYVAMKPPVLPFSEHTKIVVQKEMSKSVNAFNYHQGGREATIGYSVASCKAHTGKTPKQIINEAKKRGLKSKDRSSAKAVLRVDQPAIASCMSFADNLRAQGHDPEQVFAVSRTAEVVFAGMLNLGITPAELTK
jgi:prophage antirepressor-like protein